MRKITLAIIIFAFSLLTVNLWGQNASVRGFVYNESNGEPVIFTNVYLKGTSIGATTDVNGFFNITKIKPGNYTLMVTYLGYDTLAKEITLKPDEILDEKLYLKEREITLEAVDIYGENQAMKTETKISVTKVSTKDLQIIPTVSGEPELAQYLQVLPGVVFTGDQGGQLYIRGGEPIQNKVIMDGMVIYNPFHSIGMFSVFDSDIIRNADVYTGGFSADYGGRISSIIDITTKEGSKKKLSGKLRANTFGSKILLEGPLKKEEKSNNSATTFIFSLKNSYLNESSKLFYDYIDEDGLPFGFLDIYGKLSFIGDNGSKVNFFGFRFDDDVNYKALTDYSWDARGGGSNFILIPENTTTLIQGNFAYSRYKMTMQTDENEPKTSEINGFNFGLNSTVFPGPHEIKYGIEMLGYNTIFNFFNEYYRFIEQNDHTTELAGFVKSRMNYGNWIIEPGVRMSYYASHSKVFWEPRLASKYLLTENIRLKAATGIYSQNLLSANSSYDVVNLFYGFLSGSDELPDEYRGEVVKHPLQTAIHYITGVELDITDRVLINIEAYYKDLTQLTNLNRNKLYADIPENHNIADYLKKDYIIEEGYAKGIDFSAKYEALRLYLWAVYSLSETKRSDELITYFPHFDRRHNANFVAAYQIGKKRNWEINARWNLGSGFPFTKTQGFYEFFDFNDINVDITNENGTLGHILSDLNKGRLPYYHRLDLSLKYKFDISRKSKMELIAGLTNVYDRENIFYVDRTSLERVNQLPLMWNVGMSLSF